MNTKATIPNTTSPDVERSGAGSETYRRKVSWGAIIAGAIVAVSTVISLGFLGAGIGLWAVEPGGDPDSISGMATTGAVYLVIAQLVALFVGGYLASRMSAAWDKQNAIMHGVVVWALATIASIWLAASAVSSIFYTSVSLVKGAASAVSTAATEVVPDDLPNFKMPEVRMDMLPPRVQDALRRQGITADNLKTETREAFRNVISRKEQAEAREIATDAAVDIIRTPSDAVSVVNAAIDDLVGKGGVISEEDRTELISVMEQRLGITKSEAETMIDRWQQQSQQVYEDATQALEKAKQDAIDKGDAATDALGTASIWSFIALLLGLVAAGGGAAVGRRPHPMEDDAVVAR